MRNTEEKSGIKRNGYYSSIQGTILFVTGEQRGRNYVCKAYVTQNYHLTEF